jgi:cytochrome c-type biogenesis protein CcmH/NrfG
LLLDRKRIRKWARWVALILAIIFCVGAVGLGVGSGVGGGNVFDALSCSSKTSTSVTTPLDQVIALTAKIATDPTDIGSMQLLATVYEDNTDYPNAALMLEKVITTDPTQKAVYFRLANLYMSSLSDYPSALAVLNKAQAKFPDDPDVYLQLGLAQRSAGNAKAAILAWQRYLTLAPNGDQAAAIKTALDALSAQATTTTTTAGTGTTVGATSTTVGATTSTSAP